MKRGQNDDRSDQSMPVHVDHAVDKCGPHVLFGGDAPGGPSAYPKDLDQAERVGDYAQYECSPDTHRNQQRRN